ncbi:MAG: hypothetical protein JSW34_03695 [Candidatus Zixiibacteriota bacterium]|nr:MAG: hypothetical protein JSW34_03695 [candidate division Zixibacteria bacterium]
MKESSGLARLVSLLAAAALMFVYCGDDATEPVDPLAEAALCLSEVDCDLGANCDTVLTVTISNCGNSAVLSWTAETDAAWLDLSASSGQTPGNICLMADSNCTGLARTAMVTVTATELADESVTITAKQSTTPPVFCVSLLEWEPSKLGEVSPEISVTNCGNDVSLDWEAAEDEDWLTISTTSGSTPAGFTITANINVTGETRTGMVWIAASALDEPPRLIIVNQPSAVVIHETMGYATGVYVSGDLAYVSTTNGVEAIDVSDPTAPVLVDTENERSSYSDVCVSGEYIYAADFEYYRLAVFEAYANNPLIDVKSVLLAGPPRGLFCSGDYAYVACDGCGFFIFDISDLPSSVTEVGSCADLIVPEAIFVVGSYAYVTALSPSTYGFNVIDISNPVNPVVIGTCNTQGSPRAVLVSGIYAYIADGASGFQIINVSDPQTPTLMGNCDTPDHAWSVFLVGEYAYVADGDSGIQVIDISDPSNPTLVTSHDTPGEARDIFVVDGYAYVADGYSGLVIVELEL